MSFGNSRKNFTLGGSDSPSDALFFEACSPYIVLRRALRLLLLLIFFIELIVLRHGADFIGMEGISFSWR